jgi:hypothetical protein
VSTAVDRILPKRWLSVFLALLVLAGAFAQDKKPPKKDGPRVIMAIPLGAAPGTTTKITIRGLKLDQATAIRFQDARATARILSKGTAPVPDKNAGQVGDTQLVAEVTLPSGKPAGPVTFVVVTPAGETAPHRLLVETDVSVVAEKEPNNGFRQAQKINVPQAVDGIIQHAKDVDVFRFEGKAGQKLVCEVLAARFGSGLDSLLTLYDNAGRELASNDDMEGSTDSRLEVTLPKTGSYYLSLQDAHDLGGPAHVYRLMVRTAK